ncbi:MAG: cysteine hydrolase [Acidimicrobiia bacterium]|nr:cysteine hydrolase [Acidimicrobiia bacterium]
MPTDLHELVTPSRTAVLTMEMQRGITGDKAMMTELRDLMVEAGTIANIASIVWRARDAGARVVHCTAETRPDGAGRVDNCRLLAATAAGAALLNPGSDGAQLIPELGVDEADIVLPRLHGLTPFTSTSLDQILRNLGVTTVVATGNSVNVGILGLVISAVDLGYQVVVARDAVAGVPVDYVDAVMANTIGLLATVVSTADLLRAWPER